jgi:hypothetical protein
MVHDLRQCSCRQLSWRDPAPKRLICIGQGRLALSDSPGGSLGRSPMREPMRPMISVGRTRRVQAEDGGL